MGGMVMIMDTTAIPMATDTETIATGIVVIMAQSVVSIIGDKPKG
jgi:hypothetical protein